MKIKTFEYAFKIISSGIGIVGGVIGMISYKGDYGIIGISSLLIVISIALISSVYKLYKRRTTTVIGNVSIPRYSVKSAKKEDLKEIALLQSSYYPDDAVPYNVYLEWFEANPDGFFVIVLTTTDSAGIETNEIVGHFTFLAIKPACMNIYRRGDMLETGIRKENLFSPNEKAQMDSIYVESVILKKAHRRFAIFCLLRMLGGMVAHFCGVLPEKKSAEIQTHAYSVKKVYAMAATADGKRTLTGMGFKEIIIEDKKERLDRHEMFECEFPDFLTLIRTREEMYEINSLN